MSIERRLSPFTRRDWETEEGDGTVRLAIVGLGGFVRERVLPALDGESRCEPTVFVSGSPDRASRLADEHDVVHVLGYEEFEDGAGTDAYDAVYVGTPNATHDDHAITAADHRKHVLCEKPLSVSADRARTIHEACADAGVTLMTAYRLQTEPTVRRTRELVDDGTIGDFVQLHGSFSHSLLAYAGSGSWRLDPELSGGGALIDLGIYPLNTARFLLGADPTHVSATTHSSGPPFDAVDEHVAFQFTFPSGATASCTASFDAYPHSRLQLVGTDGAISIASPFGGIVPHDIVVESGDLCMEYTGEPVDEVREQFDYFAYCVLTGTDPEPDGADGVADLAVIEAAYESAETGRRVQLDDMWYS